MAITSDYTCSYMARQTSELSYNTLDASLQVLEEQLGPHLDKFKGVVVSGFSGAVPGAIFAYNHNKQLILVRKNEDSTHGKRMEGASYLNHDDAYVVIDDFCSLGRTMCRILDHMTKSGYGIPLYVAFYAGSWRPLPLYLDYTYVFYETEKSGLFTVTKEINTCKTNTEE